MTTREHGTRAMYVSGCKCDACRKANTEAELHRARQIAYGRWKPYVDAEPARQHVRALMEQGMGWKRVADVAGISRSSVCVLLYGSKTRNGRPPSRRIRPETEAALLGVELDLADKALIPAQGTRRRIQALVCIGYSQAVLAGRLGVTPSNFNWTFLNAASVRKSTAEAVKVLYDELSMKPPVPTTKGERISVNRALRHSTYMMWLPPLAWDDDTIDDPFAEPAIVEDEVVPHTRAEVDEIAVERALNGDRVKLTKPDREEVVRRWLAAGRPISHLEAQLGIRADRYIGRETA
jgi:hypothetical protein